ELLLPKGLTVCQAREAALPMRQLFFVVVLVQGRGIVDLGKRAFVSIERRRRRAWDGFLSRGRRTAQGTEYFLTRANAAHTFVGAWNHLPGSEAEISQIQHVGGCRPHTLELFGHFVILRMDHPGCVWIPCKPFDALFLGITRQVIPKL